MSEKERSPEEVKARDERKTAKKQAFQIMKELADKQQDPKYKNALMTIRPSLYGVARSSSSGGAAAKFVALVNERKEVNEDVVFKELKIGRKECAGYIRKHLRRSDPNDRIWIAFNAGNGMYKVVGKGSNPPAGWTGYEPVEEDVDLK